MRELSGVRTLTPLHTLLTGDRAKEHPVCHDGERFVLWREFSGRAARCADRFKSRPESRWLLASEEPLDFAILLLALLHAGKQVVIPPNTQPGTLEQLKSAFDASAGDETPALRSPPGSASRLRPIDPHAAIIDLYTSGSTGEPKRVRRTLAQFEAEIEIQESVWGAALGDAVIVATVPHNHIYGLLFRLLWPLSAGRSFDTVTCATPDTLGARLSRLRDTALVSSPAQLTRLPELTTLSSLAPAPRIIFSSGGPLPAAAAAEFHRQLGRAPAEIFGSTETGGIAWRRQEGDDAWTSLPGMSVGRDSDGALLLCSPFLADKEALRMDDAVELLGDGRFRLRGRLDRTVKIEGKRLSLPDMEAMLASHQWVAAAAVVPLPGRRERVGAAIVLNADGRRQLSAQGRRDTVLELRRHLARNFEAVLLPRHWRFPEQMPMSARGKLTHAAVAALFVSRDDDRAAA
jgi:acyl-coenzyme A synthetase/AMP-(fatty) acid ligase